MTPPPSTPPPPPTERRRSLVAPLALLVGAVALAGAGTALVASVSPDYSRISAAWDTAPDQASLKMQLDGLALRADVGYVLWGAAAAVAVVDLIVWIATLRSGGEARAWLAPTGNGVAFSLP